MGPRKSRENEAQWHGNLRELNVSSLIETLANGNELSHPFYIAKVIELIKDDNQPTLFSLKVQWYHTTSQNAFARKHALKIMTTTIGMGAKGPGLCRGS